MGEATIVFTILMTRGLDLLTERKLRKKLPPWYHPMTWVKIPITKIPKKPRKDGA
jgi:hypothetical protein